MILKVESLNFAYNGTPVLRDINLELRRGEAVGLLGVNGAGKSTLLRCLNRVLKPRDGVVLLDGQPLHGLDGDQIARLVGYVPQEHRLGPLTVFDAVLLGRKPHLKWRSSPRDLAVVERVLERLRLAPLAFRPLDSLSGGEAQKVLLARALAQEPAVLLLDEPTSNLDLRNQLEVMEIVADAVRRERMAAVVSVHDLNLALRHLDALILLKDGRVHARVDTHEVTPELIRQVYGVEVALGRVADRPVVIPLQAA